MSDQAQASHILLMYEGSAQSSATRTKEEAQQQMTDLQKQIADGGDFGALAKEHSDCPSGSQGGDLGKFGPGQMVPEFEKATFAMEVGQTSDIIETSFGYHLIQRTG